MEEIIELALLFVFSLLGLIIGLRLRLPTVIGILLAGAIVGPNALDLVKNSEIVAIFSDMGAILLLFVIGIEFSISKIMKFGIRAIIVAFLKITFVFVVCYELAGLFGLQPLEGIIVGSIFAITSTTLFSKIIGGNFEQNKDEVNLMFAVLILEDLFAVFFLTIISTLPTEMSVIGTEELVLSIIKSIVLLAAAYVLLHKLVKFFFDKVLMFKTDETLVFGSLSVCAIFAFISSLLGFEASIGAFLAGSLMTSLSEFKRIEKTILPFGLFFSSFFFLSVGMSVQFANIPENLFIIAALIVVSILAKFFSVSLSTYLLGYTSRSAIFSGITMLTVGEFSLLIAQKASGLVSFDLIGIVSVSVFLSAILSVLVIKRETQIDGFFIEMMPQRVRNSGRRVSRYLNSVVVEFEPSGKFYRASMGELKHLLLFSTILVLLNGVLYLVENLIQTTGLVNFDEGMFLWGRLLLHLVISLGPLLKMGRSLDIIISEFIDAFRKIDKHPVPLEKRVVYDAVTVVALLGLSALIPLIMTVAPLPSFINHLSTVLLIISLMFTWDAVKTAHLKIKSITRKRQSYNPRMRSFSRLSKIRSLGMFLNI